MIPIILVVLAGISNAIMDIIVHKFNKSVFSKINNDEIRMWCDPKIAWKFKYKNSNPVEGPKFWGSTTIFVYLMDLWHFAQFLMLTTFTLAILTYSPIVSFFDNQFYNYVVDFLILRGAFNIPFEMFYAYILHVDGKQKLKEKFPFLPL